jgi:hypothetical protein
VREKGARLRGCSSYFCARVARALLLRKPSSSILFCARALLLRSLAIFFYAARTHWMFADLKRSP